MLSRIKRWWRQRQQKIDVAVLWPEFARRASSREEAEKLFHLYMIMDAAYEGMSYSDKKSFLKELPDLPWEGMGNE